MNLSAYYAHHPEDVKHYDTQKLRDQFLLEQAMVPGQINLGYTHVDRMVFGGVVPTTQPLELSGGKDFATDQFLERRELGIICIQGSGSVTLGDKTYPMNQGDGLYVGMGNPNPKFTSTNGQDSAKFYLASTPAHQTYPTVHIPKEKSNPRHLGNPETVNVRTIYQYVHPAICKSCQLLMGLTELASGSVWNTMPCHTHERRSEVYFYFNMADTTRIFHLHGQPQETRHLVIANEQAVTSPSWSIHSGVGTGSYSFIWSMAGENQDFDDMDMIDTRELK